MRAFAAENGGKDADRLAKCVYLKLIEAGDEETIATYLRAAQKKLAGDQTLDEMPSILKVGVLSAACAVTGFKEGAQQ